MLINKINSFTDVQRIGKAMRVIRNARGESADAVSEKLGYENTSSYCKLERGEKKTLCIEKILIFCKHFNFNIIFLFIMADIEIFKNEINTWTEFYQSLSKIPDKRAAELMQLSKMIKKI